MTDFALPAPTGVLPGTLARRQRQTYSFGDLVHTRWHHTKNPADDRAHERYEEIRATFEAEHGKIVDDYWSKREPAGIALCCKRSRWGRLEWSLHRGMGNLAVGAPAYSPLLLRVARDSVRANSLLRGMTQRMATANLFALSRDIIASLDAKGGGPKALEAYTRDLHDIADFAGEAGKRAARIVYLKGLFGGLLGVAALTAALAYLVSSVAVPDVDSTLLVGCVVAGSLGAVMSVLIRLSSGSLEVDHQFGREYLTSLAGLRPFIGAAFALLLYFAFKAKLLGQVNVPDHGRGEFAFYFTSGFLVGFSERFAKQIVRNAESGVGGGPPDVGSEQDVAGSPATPPAAGAPARA